MAELWSDISFVSRSPNRRRVLEEVSEPITPTKIAKESRLDRGYVSALLIDLAKRGLITCLTPGEVRHRLFKRTKKGEKILTEIKRLESGKK